MSEPTYGGSADVLLFGPYQLHLDPKELWRGTERLRLGGRALDILIAIASRSGEVVDKADIIGFAWPNTFVDESNLRVHITTLRKVLGEAADGRSYITNVSGRGYSIAATVTRTGQVSGLQLSTMRNPCPIVHHLPRVIGRDDVVDAIPDQFEETRLLTIVGPPGVGKSTVASAAARFVSVRKSYPLCLVQVTSIDQSSDLPGLISAALGLAPAPTDPLTALTDFLAEQRLLLIIDNCEHLIDAAADVIAAIIARAPGVDVLATSREPLRVDMEQVLRLAPLPLPEAIDDADTEKLLANPAVQLFVERASAKLQSGGLSDDEVRIAAHLCVRLDGVPLAIELIAGQVNMFGISGVQQELDDGVLLAAKGLRSADSRQHSLRSMLDWSHATLTRTEAAVLRRLSVFRGPFSSAYAAAVAIDGQTSATEVTEALLALTSKSLIVTNSTKLGLFYRMLNVTRAYAWEKLEYSGERGRICALHAAHFVRIFTEADRQWDELPREAWIEMHEHAGHDVRAAIQWAVEQDHAETGRLLAKASRHLGVSAPLIATVVEPRVAGRA